METVIISEAILKDLKENFNIELNAQQKQAILHKDGPAIVLAVPGAGKTTTMVVRIYILVKCHGISPRNILTMTFSRASARDMKERYIKLFGEADGDGIVFSTIHSFALSVIKSYERKYNMKYNIIEGSGDNNLKVNKIAILKKIYRELNDAYIAEDELDELCNSLGLVSNRMIKIEDFHKHSFSVKNFTEIYKSYCQIKAEHNLIDFDDMLTKALDILRENNDILRFYNNQYKYVLIDEGQDTSLVQHELVKLLVSPKNNLFIVADDDQSIYGFRGAEPRELRDFHRNYRGAKKYFIEKNYRSTRNIVAAANEFIKINTDREKKNMSPERNVANPINIKYLRDEEEQLKFLLKYVGEPRGNGNTAVLYRNNISALILIDELDRNKISFQLKDGKVLVLKHWIIQDILAFMNFAIDESDMEAFERIYYKMDAFLPKALLEYLKKRHRASEPIMEILLDCPGLTPQQLVKLYELDNKFKFLRALGPLDGIEYISTEFNYSRYIKKYCKENNVSEASSEEIIFILRRMSKHTDTLVQFIYRVSQLERLMNEAAFNKNPGAVMLSTIHGAKGLEFDRVILIDLIEGNIPSSESLQKMEEDKDESMLNEEARVFYVGMTRAREELTLIALDYKNSKRAGVSRFLTRVEEITNPDKPKGEAGKKAVKVSEPSEKIITFPVGTRVRHNHYGGGTVTKGGSFDISINFDKAGLKTFPLSSVNKYLFLD